MKAMLKLPDTQFQWSKWDCFTLANYVRNFIDGSSLPNIDWVYLIYTEENQPKKLILDVVEFYCQPVEKIETGNLVVLEIDGVFNLGTVYKESIYLEIDGVFNLGTVYKESIYKESIIYMGSSSASYQTIDRMNRYLHSVWNYGKLARGVSAS